MGPHSHSYAPLVICVQRTVQMFAAFQVAYRDSAHSAHSAQKRCMPPILSRLTTKTKTKTKTNASYQRMLSSLSVKIARFSLLTLAHSHSRLQLLFILFMLCALFVYVSLFVVGFLLHLAAVVCYRALQYSILMWVMHAKWSQRKPSGKLEANFNFAIMKHSNHSKEVVKLEILRRGSRRLLVGDFDTAQLSSQRHLFHLSLSHIAFISFSLLHISWYPQIIRVTLITYAIFLIVQGSTVRNIFLGIILIN